MRRDEARQGKNSGEPIKRVKARVEAKLDDFLSVWIHPRLRIRSRGWRKGLACPWYQHSVYNSLPHRSRTCRSWMSCDAFCKPNPTPRLQTGSATYWTNDCNRISSVEAFQTVLVTSLTMSASTLLRFFSCWPPVPLPGLVTMLSVLLDILWVEASQYTLPLRSLTSFHRLFCSLPPVSLTLRILVPCLSSSFGQALYQRDFSPT